MLWLDGSLLRTIALALGGTGWMASACDGDSEAEDAAEAVEDAVD